jgi:hypothetical protein
MLAVSGAGCAREPAAGSATAAATAIPVRKFIQQGFGARGSEAGGHRESSFSSTLEKGIAKR